MDPDANLAEQLRLAARMQELDDAGESPDSDDALRLAELVIALNDWLRHGGYAPEAWPRSRISKSDAE